VVTYAAVKKSLYVVVSIEITGAIHNISQTSKHKLTLYKISNA